MGLKLRVYWFDKKTDDLLVKVFKDFGDDDF